MKSPSKTPSSDSTEKENTKNLSHLFQGEPSDESLPLAYRKIWEEARDKKEMIDTDDADSDSERVIVLPDIQYDNEETEDDSNRKRKFGRTPSTSSLLNGHYKNLAIEDTKDLGEIERELLFRRFSGVFANWQYSDEERQWLRYKVESLTRDECIIFAVLGHILLSPEEMKGTRRHVPSSEEARQVLLMLSVGSQWDVFNLGIVMAFAEKINVTALIRSLDEVRAISEEPRTCIETVLKGQLEAISLACWGK